MLKRSWVMVVAVVVLAGCVCGPEPEPVDAGTDAGFDAGLEPEGDAGLPDAGEVDAGIPDAGQPSGYPTIDVRPSGTVDLGPIAFFAGAPQPGFAATQLRVFNIGRAPLFLLSRQVTPHAGTQASEVCVGRFDASTGVCLGDLPAYDATRGIAPGASLDLPVRITPEGLGQRVAELDLQSNDPARPLLRVRIQANSVIAPPCDVEVSPLSLDFGALSAGQSLDQAVIIRNRLTSPNDECLVSSIEVSTPGVFELVDTPRTLRIAGGARALIKVRARMPGTPPAVGRSFTSELQFALSTPTGGAVSIPLLVKVGTHCLRVSPSPMDFGTAVVGCGTSARRFDLMNYCGTNITLVAVTTTGAFRATPNFMPGTVLEPGRVLTGAISVQFRPTMAGAEVGSLRVESAGVATRVTELRGRGVAAGPVSESVAATSGKVDVLMLIDDSCSMADFQGRLSQHLPEFLDYATSRGVDFRIAAGFVGYDHDLRRLDGGVAWVEPSTPNLAAVFPGFVNAGPIDDHEACAMAAIGVFSDRKRATSVNGSVLRDDATLSVVCITDSPEGYSVQYALPALLAIKGEQRPARYRHSVMAVYGTARNCPYQGDFLGQHPAYVAATGGAGEDLCLGNWTNSMQRIAEATFERRYDYDLIGTPDLSAATGLRVFVDGTLWPETTSTNPPISVWRYDAATNRLVFNPLTQPPPGSLITVEYERACVP